jgi:hypothetical protein
MFKKAIVIALMLALVVGLTGMASASSKVTISKSKITVTPTSTLAGSKVNGFVGGASIKGNGNGGNSGSNGFLAGGNLNKGGNMIANDKDTFNTGKQIVGKDAVEVAVIGSTAVGNTQSDFVVTGPGAATAVSGAGGSVMTTKLNIPVKVDL